MRHEPRNFMIPTPVLLYPPEHLILLPPYIADDIDLRNNSTPELNL